MIPFIDVNWKNRDSAPWPNLTCMLIRSDRTKMGFLRSCGTEERALTGTFSDYDLLELFVKKSKGKRNHTAVRCFQRELKKLFRRNMPTTPEETKDLWESVSEAFSSGFWTEKQLCASMGIRTVSMPVQPSERERFKKQFPESCRSFTVPALDLRDGWEDWLSAFSDWNDAENALETVLNAYEEMGGHQVILEAARLADFETPDAYHAAIALKKLHGKELPEPEEKSCLSSQMVRILFSCCVRHDGIVLLDGGNRVYARDAFDRVGRYMKKCRLFPVLCLMEEFGEDSFYGASVRFQEEFGNAREDGKPSVRLIGAGTTTACVDEKGVFSRGPSVALLI